MKVGICYTRLSSGAKSVFEAFAEGLEKNGDEPVIIRRHDKRRIKAIRACDITFQIYDFVGYQGSHNFVNDPLYKVENKVPKYLNKHYFHPQVESDCDRTFLWEIKKEQRRSKKRRLILEAGYVRHRRERGGDLSLPRRYHSISFDGTKRYGNYYNENSPKDRWEKLNVQLKSWRTSGKHILVLGEFEYGISTMNTRKFGFNVYDWAANIIRKAQSLTGREVVYRCHPSQVKIGHVIQQIKNVKITMPLKVNSGELKKSTADRRSLEEDLQNCWCVICPGATNGSVDALVNGIPIITPDTMNMAYDLAEHNIENIENPIFKNRKQWFYDLAYTQWSSEEIERGTAWQYLKQCIDKPLEVCSFCGFRPRHSK